MKTGVREGTMDVQLHVPGIAESLVRQESERVLQPREEEKVEKVRESENSEVAKICREPYTQPHENTSSTLFMFVLLRY